MPTSPSSERAWPGNPVVVHPAEICAKVPAMAAGDGDVQGAWTGSTEAMASRRTDRVNSSNRPAGDRKIALGSKPPVPGNSVSANQDTRPSCGGSRCKAAATSAHGVGASSYLRRAGSRIRTIDSASVSAYPPITRGSSPQPRPAVTPADQPDDPRGPEGRDPASAPGHRSPMFGLLDPRDGHAFNEPRFSCRAATVYG